MKVLYISRGYSPHDHRFLAAISDLGHDTYYLRLATAGTLETRPLHDGITNMGSLLSGGIRNPFDYLPALRKLQGELHRLQPDLVHAGPIPDVAWLVSLTGFRPLVSMSWGSDLLLEARGGFQRMKAGWALKRSGAMICDCEAVRQVGIRLGMPEQNIVVFPWGIDLDHFSPSRGRPIGDQIILLSTRSHEPLYGVDLVVEAFIIARQQTPGLFLKIAGDGSMRTELETRIHSAGVGDDVEFLGQVQYADLPELYRSADLYISASHSDGSSVSLLEAMASGLPVVVSDIPGNREWVAPGTNGSWFSDGDAEELAEKILEISQDSGVMEAMGIQGRQIVETRANWRQNRAGIDQAYQIAINEQGSR